MSDQVKSKTKSNSIDQMSKKKIIKGYKGIMDLDLTNVNPSHHKIMISQHEQDILDYMKEQEKLKPEQRYDNTIGKAIQKVNIANKILAKRMKFQL